MLRADGGFRARSPTRAVARPAKPGGGARLPRSGGVPCGSRSLFPCLAAEGPFHVRVLLRPWRRGVLAVPDPPLDAGRVRPRPALRVSALLPRDRHRPPRIAARSVRLRVPRVAARG